MRKFWLVTAVAVVAMLAAFSSPSASAPNATPKATGSVGMSLQYMSFNAFDYGEVGDRGTVHYANFDYASPGSGVWTVGGTFALTFASAYTHTFIVDSVMPTSSTSSEFTGHGWWNGDPAYTWVAEGTVDGAMVSFHILYTGTAAGYFVHATGTIASDGTMSGTALDSSAQVLPWSTTVAAHEVLSYTASVTCAVVSSDTDATFGYTIPEGFGSLSGVTVAVKVHDGGSPAVEHDTLGFAAPASCDVGSVTNYPTTSGNLVVH